MEILKLLAALASLIFGVVALLRPRIVARMAGVGTDTAKGEAEVRISWGGLFIALALGVIILNSPQAYQLFGIAYLGTFIVRIGTIAADRSLLDGGFIVSGLFELVSAVIFLLPSGQ